MECSARTNALGGSPSLRGRWGTQDQVGQGSGQPDPLVASLPRAGEWNWLIFKVPSNLGHSVIVRFNDLSDQHEDVFHIC